MKIAVVFLVFAVVYGLRKRAQVCPTDDRKKCTGMWLNEIMSKPRGMPIHVSLSTDSPPHVFCYDGSLFLNMLIHIWDNLHISIHTMEPDNIAVYYGNTSHSVLSQRKKIDNISHPLSLSPFKVHCVGIHHVHGEAKLSINASLQLWLGYPLVLVVGLFFLYFAPYLSRNVPLIYGTGIAIGILGSVIVLVYIMSRYLPGRSFLGFGFLAGGYTFVASLVYWFYDNMVDLTLQYWEYVLGYVVATGLISFGIIYRWGGVSNPRTFDLIRWSLQLIGFSLVVFSTSDLRTSVVTLVIVLFTYFVPIKYNPLSLPFCLLYWMFSCFLAPFVWCCHCLNRFKRRAVYPTRRLLTQEEYELEGRRETEKALNELRQYCKKKKTTGIISKLKDPNRFAGFMLGKDHVSPEERVNHDWTFMDDSDDDDGDSSACSQHTPSPSHQPPPRPSPSLSPPHPSPSHSPSRPSPSHSPPHPSPQSPNLSSYFMTAPARSFPLSRSSSGLADIPAVQQARASSRYSYSKSLHKH